MKKEFGMTLVEVMAVLGIMGVMLLIALGPITGMIRGERVKNTANVVFSSLLFARTEAVKRNSCVDVVPVNVNNWSLGWTVRVPTTGGVAACGGAGTPTVLRRYPAVAEVTVAGPTASVNYTGAGRLTTLGDSSTASLCNNSCTTTCSVNNAPPSFRFQLTDTTVLRCVSVRASGSPEIKKG